MDVALTIPSLSILFHFVHQQTDLEGMQRGVHPCILKPIRRLQLLSADGDEGEEDDQQHILCIFDAKDVSFQSVQYLVDFLNGDTHQITELILNVFSLSHPPDGGVDVLQGLFANNLTLTKIRLNRCQFGNEEEAIQLLAALQENRTVNYLAIDDIQNLEDKATLGNCISGFLLNMPQLQ
jgi:hypothetical protein